MQRLMQVIVDGNVVHEENVMEWAIIMNARHFERLFNIAELKEQNDNCGIGVIVPSRMNKIDFKPLAEEWDNKINEYFKQKEAA